MSLPDDILAGLSAETLRALKEFALQKGVNLDPESDDTAGVLTSVQKHFQIQDREEVFHINYTSKDNSRKVNFTVKGIKKELGQTLQSTGLTIWRAAEHLCQYIMDHSDRFEAKSVCELGGGLGLVTILLDKLNICSTLVCTDGDEDTLQLLIENQIQNESLFDTAYLYWGEHEDFLSEHPDLFDCLIAADVIYEEEQIVPLLTTVAALLKRSGEFILAFARRNVPVDKVLAKAEELGLQYKIIDESPDGISMEPIYCFTWKK